jgi:hypothetical protein
MTGWAESSFTGRPGRALGPLSLLEPFQRGAKRRSTPGASHESALALPRLIVGADQRVRNAFRATLRDEPSTASLISTAELDPGDVLEVGDLADAIARAEQVIRERASGPRLSTPAAPSSSGVRDIFDALVTDDCVGPAVHAPYIPTPIPPRPTPVPPPPQLLAHNRASTIPPPPPNGTQQLPEVRIPSVARTAPILVLDEDAFYYPAGKIPGFAAGTVEDHGPARSFLRNLRERPVLLSWIAVVILAPLTLLSLFAVGVGIGRARAAREAAVTSRMAAPKHVETPAAPVETAPQPIVAAQPTAHPTPEAAPAPEVPVLDVNSLKTAPPSKRSKPSKARR